MLLFHSNPALYPLLITPLFSIEDYFSIVDIKINKYYINDKINRKYRID